MIGDSYNGSTGDFGSLGESSILSSPEYLDDIADIFQWIERGKYLRVKENENV